jgi:hypothetical protein
MRLFISATNVVVEWLTLLHRIREFPGSNLRVQIGYLIEFVRGFSQSLQANAGVVPQN